MPDKLGALQPWYRCGNDVGVSDQLPTHVCVGFATRCLTTFAAMPRTITHESDAEISRALSGLPNGWRFFCARVKAIADYVAIRPGQRVIDIGCGPGHILRYLPPGIDYIGFDIDQSYIDYAKSAFGDRGKFYCRYFDDEAAKEYAPADVVMMNGVLHNISDDDLTGTLTSVRNVLRESGVLFTLDGCYAEKQSRIAKWLLDNDCGEFVRDRKGYADVLGATFPQVDLAIRDDYSWVPYTFAIGVSRKRAAT